METVLGSLHGGEERSCCHGAAVTELLLVARSTPSTLTWCCAAPCTSLSAQLHVAPLAQHQPRV